MILPVKQYLDLLLTYLRPQWLKVLGLAALLFSSIGLQLLSPQVIRYFIDAALAGAAQQTLTLTALLFVVIVLAQQGLAIATTYTGEGVAWTATNNLRTDLTRHILHLDLSFHNAHTPGELLERIDGDVERLANFFSQFVLQILSGLLLLAGVLVMLFLEDWRLGLVLSLFAGIYLAVHAWDQQLAVPHWQQERQMTAELSGFVGERLSGLKDIQTSGAGVYTMQRFYDLLRRALWQHTRADVVTDIGWTISKLLYGLGFTVALALGVYLFRANLITLGGIYLVIHYLEMLNGPLNRIAGELEDLQQAKVSIERVKQLTETRSKIESGSRSLPAGPLALTFEAVSFGYHPGKPVLRDISFQLPPGRVLGLLGRTGSGKTTISRLLFRLYEPDEGTIRLNGIDLRHFRLDQLRQGIGLVTQEVQLFQASVRDNLTLFDESVPDERLLESFAALGLTPWYETLPQGLDTLLSGEGYGLSAGEAQLLALTRVFLKDPSLVILDEASSRLDPATERLLERAIDRLLHNRTGLIIAHRLATVQRADELMILEEGQIKEYGAYGVLSKRPGSLFSTLLRTGLQEAPV